MSPITTRTTAHLGKVTPPADLPTPRLVDVPELLLADTYFRFPRVDLDGDNIFRVMPRPVVRGSLEEVFPIEVRRAFYRYAGQYRSFQESVAEATPIAGSAALVA